MRECSAEKPRGRFARERDCLAPTCGSSSSRRRRGRGLRSCRSARRRNRRSLRGRGRSDSIRAGGETDEHQRSSRVARDLQVNLPLPGIEVQWNESVASLHSRCLRLKLRSGRSFRTRCGRWLVLRRGRCAGDRADEGRNAGDCDSAWHGERKSHGETWGARLTSPSADSSPLVLLQLLLPSYRLEPRSARGTVTVNREPTPTSLCS
jgi:hypothetical protein